MTIICHYLMRLCFNQINTRIQLCLLFLLLICKETPWKKILFAIEIHFLKIYPLKLLSQAKYIRVRFCFMSHASHNF